jgi:hypothetical protein
MLRAPHRRFASFLGKKPFGLLAALAAVAWINACSEDQTRLAPSDVNPGEVESNAKLDKPKPEKFPFTHRFEPSISAVGPFRPGVPIQIRSSVKANRNASTGTYTLMSLDNESAALLEGRPPKPRVLTRAVGGMARGGRKDLASSITFKQPGYYRVRVYAEGSGDQARTSPDTTVIDTRARELWMLVDSAGGRLTNGFDSTAIAGRSPAFGSYVAFRPPASLRAPAALAGPYNYSGTVSYLLQNGQPVPLVDAQVTAGCGQQTQFGLVFTNTNFQTGPGGSFAYTCPADKPYTRTNINMINTYAYVGGRDGQFAGAGFSGANGGVFNGLLVANDGAGWVHDNLKVVVPRAFAKFSRSRARVTVYVSETDPGYGGVYFASPDRIELGPDHLYTQYGIFTVAHEYGHAFHWKAIEAPYSSTCNPEEHEIHLLNTAACAFKEGFADFFAVWVAGPELISGWLSDYGIEINPWTAYGDGSRIEGPAAAFMYDLVDGASEPDSPSNTSNGDEWFDTASYPGSFIVDIIRSCSLVAVSSRYALDGMDQFVYCAERGVSAKPLGASWWRSYSGVSNAPAPPGWDAALIRRLWRYNFYNVAP